MVSLFDALSNYLLLCIDDTEQFEKTYRRALAVIETFDLLLIIKGKTIDYTERIKKCY